MTAAGAAVGVVTIGETMALVGAETYGPLQHSRGLSFGIGGAESNVAIGLRRLGVDATWIGKVGEDPLGEFVVREIRAEGVRVESFRDAEAPTALMIKERRTAAETRIWYYRAGSAGSRLALDDVDFDLVRQASLLHLTGITPALSEGMAEVVDEALRVAQEAGTPVSFDLNFRRKLWTPEEAAVAYGKIIPQVDVVFGGDDEAAIALGSGDTPLGLARRLVGLGAREAVVKLGAFGAVAVSGGEEFERAAIPINPVDTVGAGDAFVAGYLAEYLAGAPVPERLTTGVRVGAYACMVSGDWEGLPRREELERFTGEEAIRR